MATILDTNVASELMNYRPQAAVVDWWCHQALEGTFVAAIIEMELRYGIAIMTEGRRRCRLSREVDDLLAIEFGDRVLSFDSAAALAYAVIAAQRRAMGHVVGQSDTQIAAIALSLGMTAAARNVRHFADCGVELVNLWSTEGSV